MPVLHALPLLCALTALCPGLASAGDVDFNRDVRPILSDKCFRCHGPDEGERQAELRLDQKENVFAPRANGVAVVPGKSAASLVHQRITATNPSDRMPPVDSGKSLSPLEVEVLRRWIDQGADWSGHWSFVPPRRSALPAPVEATSGSEPQRNAIDGYIRARLAAVGLHTSPPADPITLVRRVTLDLTGLPPTLAEVDAFVADAAGDSYAAYERLVDRLLTSSRYGEHMARYWLDLVRYGDTHGLHFDNERGLWPYRDWVIRAFNENKPFDAFTIEQLAGDLLPEPSVEQLVATGFNRCNVSTSEGGSIDEEVLVRYAVDRVEAVGTVWLGLTVGCAVCHDHKFDPISQKEFYQLFAFFNSFEENAMDGNALLPPPFRKAPTQEQSAAIASARSEAQALRQSLDGPLPEVDAAEEKWALELAAKLGKTWQVVAPTQAISTGGARLRALDDGSLLVEGSNPDKDVYELILPAVKDSITAIRLEALRHESHPHGGAGRADNANFVLSELEASVVYPSAAGATQQPSQAISFLVAQADYSQQGFEIARAIDANTTTGWAVDGPTRREDSSAIFFPAAPIVLSEGSLLRLRLVQDNGGRHTIGRLRLSVSADTALAPAVLEPWSLVGLIAATSAEEAYTRDFGPESKLDLQATFAEGKLKWETKPDLVDGKVHAFAAEVGVVYLHRLVRSTAPQRLGVALGSDDGIKVWLNGKLVHENRANRAAAADQDQATLELAAGDNHLLVKVANFGGASGFYFRRHDAGSRNEVLDLGPVLAVAPDRRSDAERKRLRDYYRANYSPEWKALQARVGDLDKKAQELEAKVPGTMVSKEMAKRRDAFVLVRGEYTQKGEKVTPAVPAVFSPLGEGEPENRLGLARWLVRPDHPLTARVTVNRFWQQYFGAGIVKTAVDFGAQGEWPMHPELLDFLAVDFVASGWDVKRLQKMIVLSATYRQAAQVSSEALEKDPENRLLSRGPRFRMDAEMIRDSALATSGLLVERLGGRSVKPYQPGGIWEAVAFVGSDTSIYKQDPGDGLYRRGLYTFWKRTSPPPVLSLFDAPSRETCTAVRPRTNTPLQALAMMNDIQFFEASRHLAERMMREGGVEPASRIAHAFRLATARQPRSDELDVLLETFQAHHAEYQADPDAALKAVSVGESKRDEALDPRELAAYTLVANLILNLDETLTKG